MYYAPMSFPVLVFLIVAFICYMRKTSPKKSQSSLFDDLMDSEPMPLSTRERENIAEMERVVAQYEGYTAEVFDITVFGRKKVDTFRLLNPGRKVELRKCSKELYEVLAFGDSVADLFAMEPSNLPQLFEENIPFYAYLGGRNRAFMSRDDFDDCKIIVFYKMDGVPPTKVNLS